MVLACESIFSRAGLIGCQTTKLAHILKSTVFALTCPRSASNVSGKVQSHLCLTEWWGKRKYRRGKSTFWAACPARKIMFCNLCCTLTHMLIRPFCSYSNFRCIEVVEPRGTGMGFFHKENVYVSFAEDEVSTQIVKGKVQEALHTFDEFCILNHKGFKVQDSEASRGK